MKTENRAMSSKNRNEKSKTAMRFMCLILAIAMLAGFGVYLFILIGGGF